MTPAAVTASRVDALRDVLRPLGSAAVALSGGVDSSLLLAVAHEVLGARVVAVTGVSPSLADGEVGDAERVAAHVGARLVRIDTHEMSDPRYVRNAPDRCYFCKGELYDRVAAWCARNGIEHVLDGLNADDDPGDRPGVRAGAERRVRSPLREAGMTKADIRVEAARRGLPTAWKPAAPCLASRIPHGTQVTAERLRAVGSAESALRRLGFTQLRVRHEGEAARVELPRPDVERALTMRRAVRDAIRSAGFERVLLDLDGLRTGGANRAPGGAPRVEELR